MEDSWIGKTIGHYQIIEHLGRGGMAEVYKAYQPALDRHVAVKILHPFVADDETFLARFEREARAVAGRTQHRRGADAERPERGRSGSPDRVDHRRG